MPQAAHEVCGGVAAAVEEDDGVGVGLVWFWGDGGVGGLRLRGLRVGLEWLRLPVHEHGVGLVHGEGQRVAWTRWLWVRSESVALCSSLKSQIIRFRDDSKLSTLQDCL